MKLWTAPLLLLLAPGFALADPAPPSPAREYKSFRLAPAPPEACGSYMITESGFFVGDEGHILIEWGCARNLGKTHSVGLTGFLGMSSERTQSGFHLRFVEWMGRTVCVNISPGIVLAGDVDGSTAFKTPQFAAQVGVNRRWLGFAVDMFTTNVRDTDPGFPPEPSHGPVWRVGFRIGGKPGLIGTAGALYAGAVFVSGD